jgi:hypothetical protein
MRTSTVLLNAAVLSLLLSATPTLHAADHNRLTPEQVAAGWITLFDGESLAGWQKTGDADWHVANGEFRVAKGEAGWLMTTSELADYELHVEFKAPAKTNSGVFLRTPLDPKDPTRDCIEVNIAPSNNPFPTASVVGRTRVALSPVGYSVATPQGRQERRQGGPRESLDPWDDAWHAFDLALDGFDLRIRLDGVLLTTTRLDPETTPRRGRIGLQFREGEVAFRNVRLKPLGLQPMLTGRDLAGWNTSMTRDSKFTVADNGELHVKNGPGILETEASYGDFVMQLECFVDGEGLNSGVFFRSIPRDYANGYESQINNGVKDGDPTKPVDAGTGAIYRRTAVGRVVSRDREWFAKTIVAAGPHIAVWVDGEQVTDWTDERPPHDNPREGCRTAAGTISLQGHDPTTNLRFRNLRIAELPAAASAPAAE